MKTHRYLAVGGVLLVAWLPMKSRASENEPPAPLVLQWSNYVGETFQYTMSALDGDLIRVTVNSNRGTSVITTNQFAGGMRELFKLSERAANEISTNRFKIPVGKEKCRLALKIDSQGTEKRSSIEGDLDPLLEFCQEHPALNELLGFASQDLPKKYRLIERAGPSKDILPSIIK